MPAHSDRRRQSDPALVSAAVSGDSAALQTLLEGAWPDGYRIARSILRDRQLAEDAAQEACARVVTGIALLREPVAFQIWFYRLVTREAYRRLRTEGRELPAMVMEEQLITSHVSADLLDLREAIRSLPHTYRLPIFLYYYLGLSNRDVAKVIGTTTGAVRVRLTMARRRLRSALADVPPRATAKAAPGQGGVPR